MKGARCLLKIKIHSSTNLLQLWTYLPAGCLLSAAHVDSSNKTVKLLYSYTILLLYTVILFYILLLHCCILIYYTLIFFYCCTLYCVVCRACGFIRRDDKGVLKPQCWLSSSQLPVKMWLSRHQLRRIFTETKYKCWEKLSKWNVLRKVLKIYNCQLCQILVNQNKYLKWE